LVALRSDLARRPGNTLRADWPLIALGPLVGDRQGFDDHIGPRHIDLERLAGFDREIDIHAGEVDVNCRAIGGR
jgi:hypothetical protein